MSTATTRKPHARYLIGWWLRRLPEDEEFTLRDAVDALADLGQSTVELTVAQLHRDGYLQRNRVGGVWLYRVEHAPAPAYYGRQYTTNRQLIWSAVRRLRRFSTTDVVKAAGVNRVTAVGYIKALRNVGLLDRLPKHVYDLLDDIGPVAPVWFGDGRMYDPNHDRYLERTDA